MYVLSFIVYYFMVNLCNHITYFLLVYKYTNFLKTIQAFFYFFLNFWVVFCVRGIRLLPSRKFPNNLLFIFSPPISKGVTPIILSQLRPLYCPPQTSMSPYNLCKGCQYGNDWTIASKGYKVTSRSVVDNTRFVTEWVL